MKLGKQRHESKYMTIQFYHESEGWSINWIREFFEISRASYYKWLHREVSDYELENMKLAELIKEYDEKFNHILGYRRMTSWINHSNHTNYKQKRVHRIMKKPDIHAVIRKKKKKYSSYKPEAIAANPDAKPLFHSDHGFQYTSKVLTDRYAPDKKLNKSNKNWCNSVAVHKKQLPHPKIR